MRDVGVVNALLLAERQISQLHERLGNPIYSIRLVEQIARRNRIEPFPTREKELYG